MIEDINKIQNCFKSVKSVNEKLCYSSLKQKDKMEKCFGIMECVFDFYKVQHFLTCASETTFGVCYFFVKFLVIYIDHVAFSVDMEIKLEKIFSETEICYDDLERAVDMNIDLKQKFREYENYIAEYVDKLYVVFENSL